ncbi:MAG: hypothetical protein CBE33_04090 [Candidatus Pelagibacter sp. TMED273]|nr:MAG: hypothetical protein CBE33_04090 [Candidatus Pelagibacter sp. TMED273]|tara:strand:+ start:1081 stop:2019 length:939 start_codon:yes stop_codon:yes gene_type:complete
MSEKILITGGAGYIGSVLTKLLLREGYNVTVIDNFFYDQQSLLDCAVHKNFNLINGDIRDQELIEKHMRNVDIIIPLAGLVGAPICKKFPILSNEVNYEASIKLIKKKNSNQRIIMPTTNSAYGTGNKDNYCDENTPLKPISVYAEQKVELEKKLMGKNNVTSLRLATVFGPSPRMRLDLLVNDFTYRAYKDGFIVLYESEFKRNYIHVYDIANVFLFCIKNTNKTNNEIFNVGLSDTNISKLELCQRIKRIVPNLNIIESQFKKDPDQRNYIVSNDKIESCGYKTIFSLEDGIHSLLNCFKILKSNSNSNV